MNVADLGLP